MQYSILNNGDESVITVIIPGNPDSPFLAQSDHPNWKAIVAAALTGDTDVADLFDVSRSVARRFERLSERVTVAHGAIYFDGDEVHNTLTSAILRFLDDDVSDWKPLVAFFEKVASNPTEHSREQLYTWLAAHDFTLTPEGDIVGYKGVRLQDGKLVSGASGRAIVNGEVVTGHIPNEVGSTIEMPRSEVAHDPSEACSSGLHVGTFDYATDFARSGKMLKVYVNPRDVVSVPTDASGEKVRTCRYTVQEVIDAPVNTAVDYGDDDECEDDDGCDCDACLSERMSDDRDDG